MPLIDDLKPLAAKALPQLKGARRRLANATRWTKGAYARSLPSRYPASCTHKLAACWCIRGAIRAEAGLSGNGGASSGEVFVAIVAHANGLTATSTIQSLAIWNDKEATFADVTALLDKSIKLAEAIVDGSYECAMLLDVIPKTEK